MHIQRLTTLAEFEALEPSWQGLAGNNPLRSYSWLHGWWRHFGGDAELCLLAVRNDQGELVGLAPWYCETTATAGRVLRFLGSGAVCTDYLSIMCSAENENDVVAALADWLTFTNIETQEGLAWDQIDLEACHVNDAPLNKLFAALRERHCSLDEQPDQNCWRVSFTSDWEEYLKSLAYLFRKQVRKCLRQQVDTGRMQLRCASTPDEIASAWPVFVDLHQKRRTSLGEPGVFADARFAAFLPEAAQRLSAVNAARLYWLELEGRPVAVEFHLIGGDTVYMYQSGIDPAAREESPGKVMNAALLKHAFDAGLRHVDFLRGDEAYKSHWRAEPQPTRRVRITPPRALAQLRRGVWLARDSMKEWVKAGLKLTGLRKTT